MKKIRIRYGDNEIELEGDASFIKKHLDAFHQRVQHVPQVSAPATLRQDIEFATGKKSTSKMPTPAEYYKAKKRTDGISQLLIFAKYLEVFKGKSEFSRQEINALAQDAKVAKDIHGQYFSNAVRQGLLRIISKGKYSLTLSAEDVLAAMK